MYHDIENVLASKCFSNWFRLKLESYRADPRKLHFLFKLLGLPELNLIANIIKETPELEEFSMTIGSWIKDSELSVFLTSCNTLENLHFLSLELKMMYADTHPLLCSLIEKNSSLKYFSISSDSLNKDNIGTYATSLSNSKSVKRISLRSHNRQIAGGISIFMAEYGQTIYQLDSLSLNVKELNDEDSLSLIQVIKGSTQYLDINIHTEEIEDKSLQELITACHENPEHISFSLSYKEKEIIILPDISSPIAGEFHESFHELITAEIDSILDIKNEPIKILLLDALFDQGDEFHDLSLLIKYISMIDPSSSPRFIVPYCCLNTEQWKHDLAKEYERNLITSYCDRCFNGEGESDKDPESIRDNLKNYAKRLVLSTLQDRSIFKPPILDDSLLQLKQNLLQQSVVYRSKDDRVIIDIQKDIKNLEDEKSISIDEFKKFDDFNEEQENLNQKLILTPNIHGIPKNWSQIYQLIKKTPAGRVRDQHKMLQVLQAILYREDHKCRWQDLPQSMLPFTTVRPYYYSWKRQGLLESIIDLAIEKSSWLHCDVQMNKKPVSFWEAGLTSRSTLSSSASSSEEPTLIKI